MILQNSVIYKSYMDLNKEFGLNCEIKMPIKINFFLQKNIKLLGDMVREIEDSRVRIAKTYGELNSDGTAYEIKDEHKDMVQKELNDLFALTQDVSLHIFKLEDFEGLEFTFAQMNALMFMIEE